MKTRKWSKLRLKNKNYYSETSMMLLLQYKNNFQKWSRKDTIGAQTQATTKRRPRILQYSQPEVKE